MVSQKYRSIGPASTKPISEAMRTNGTDVSRASPGLRTKHSPAPITLATAKDQMIT